MAQQDAAALARPNHVRAFHRKFLMVELCQRPGHQRRKVRNAIASQFRDALVDRSDSFGELISAVVVLRSRSGEIHGAHSRAAIAQRSDDASRIKTTAEIGRGYSVISVSAFYRCPEAIIDSCQARPLRIPL